MIYILLIVIIVLILRNKREIVNNFSQEVSQNDWLHLYAMLALVPRKFETKAQRDFYIRTYQLETPMFYSARFEIALDIKKFLESDDAKEFSKEDKEEILNEYNKADFSQIRSGVDIKMSNDHACERCLYAAEDIFGIALRVYADENTIELPFVDFMGITKRFRFQSWIDSEMYYQRYQAWQENAKNIPPWHIRKNGEWDGWKVIYLEDCEKMFPPMWYFEKDYIKVYPHLDIWDRWGRNINKYNLECELPDPIQNEEN